MKKELILSTISFSLLGMDFQELAKLYSILIYSVEIRQTMMVFAWHRDCAFSTSLTCAP